MGLGDRRKAAATWDAKLKAIRDANKRRTIPLEPLITMPTTPTQPESMACIARVCKDPIGASFKALGHSTVPTLLLTEDGSIQLTHEWPVHALITRNATESDDESCKYDSDYDDLTTTEFKWDVGSGTSTVDLYSECSPSTTATSYGSYDYSLDTAPVMDRDFDSSDTPAYAMALQSLASDVMKENPAPSSPTPAANSHREKTQHRGDLTDHLKSWYCLVAKPVPKKQWDSIPTARAAVDKEWAKLRKADGGRGTWDESQVKSFYEVKKLAQEKKRNTGVDTHFAYLFDLCVEKHSELEPSKRKHKGRVVFGGHQVRDEFGLEATFTDQGSSACFLSASKACDGVSLLPGCSGEQSDAPSAYTQAALGTGMKTQQEVTWVEIPEEQWPASW